MAGEIEKARERLPLPRLMEQYGDFMPEGKRQSGKCPFCQKESASLKQHNGRWWFKCFRPQCPSATSEPKAAFDEVGYVGCKTGLNRKEAFLNYLKQAGVFVEPRHSPSTLPGQKRRKAVEPVEEVKDFLGKEAGEQPAAGNGTEEAQGTNGTDEKAAPGNSDDAGTEKPPGEENKPVAAAPAEPGNNISYLFSGTAAPPSPAS